MTMRASSLALWKALTSAVGLDELLLTLALTLIVVALWPVARSWLGTGLPALLPAGVIVLYVALPSRLPFLMKPSAPEKPTRRSL